MSRRYRYVRDQYGTAITTEPCPKCGAQSSAVKPTHSYGKGLSWTCTRCGGHHGTSNYVGFLPDWSERPSDGDPSDTLPSAAEPVEEDGVNWEEYYRIGRSLP